MSHYYDAYVYQHTYAYMYPITNSTYIFSHHLTLSEACKKRLIPKYHNILNTWSTWSSYFVSPLEFPSRFMKKTADNAIACGRVGYIVATTMTNYAKKGVDFLSGGDDNSGTKKK